MVVVVWWCATVWFVVIWVFPMVWGFPVVPMVWVFPVGKVVMTGFVVIEERVQFQLVIVSGMLLVIVGVVGIPDFSVFQFRLRWWWVLV